MIVKINHEEKRAQLSLRGKDILDVMDKREEQEGSAREFCGHRSLVHIW